MLVCNQPQVVVVGGLGRPRLCGFVGLQSPFPVWFFVSCRLLTVPVGPAHINSILAVVKAGFQQSERLQSPFFVLMSYQQHGVAGWTACPHHVRLVSSFVHSCYKYWLVLLIGPIGV